MRIWDDTHNWVLQRFWKDLTRVSIRFEKSRPTVRELGALRRCLPQFQNTPLLALREKIGEIAALQLGIMPTPEARVLIDAARKYGLHAIAESASRVSYLPLDCTTGCAWLIEDEDQSAAVAQAMLAAGVPVRDIEV
jgi:hypothetical protein